MSNPDELPQKNELSRTEETEGMPSTVSIKREIREEVSVHAVSTKNFTLLVNGTKVVIPVSEVVFTNYQNQIYIKAHRSTIQDRRLKTVQALMCAAYLKGLGDGTSKK